ncbi:MAG: ABC transporter substrate-binding protein [Microvirga sp.]|jgi:peptide/nickel transport system substrate-binding protein
MHRRFWFATVVMALAASLLASSAIAAPSAKKGGTLKGMFATDADFIDPSLAYFVHSWQIMGATGANLLRFADAEGSAGSRLVPELATGFPKVSNSGKTYTFTIRKGWKFSDNKTPVSAGSFAWAFNRALNSQQQSPAAPFVADIVGAQAVIDGKARSASGITARGNTLTIRLTKVAPDFLTRIAMPFFQAMDPKLHPIDAKGLKAPVHSAGPYYVATWTPNSRLTMKRNPGYKGNRAANVNAIEYDANVNLDAQVLRIKAGQADFAAEGISPSAHADLAKQYGINRKNGQYQVRQVPTTYYLAMNTTKGITTNANVRKAVNYAIDRQAMLAQRGYLAGKRADQILPPGIPGFRDYNIYPMKFTNANLNKAKSLMGSRSGKFLLLSGNRGASLTIPQIVKFNLGKIGLDVDVQNLASGPLSAKAGSRNEDFQGILIGWHADYPDPNNFIDILLNGSNIHESNNNNYAYLNVPALNRKMERAAGLTGAKRYSAYSALDLDISKNYAPWATYSYANNRDFISSRTGCYSYHPTWGFNLATACVK